MQLAISSPDATLLADRHHRATAIAGRLHQFERLLKLAAATGSRLAAELAEETDAEGLAAIAGHQMLLAFGNANVHVATALGHSAAGHRHLERLGQSLGYDVHAYGDVQKDPSVYGVPLLPLAG